MSKRLCITLFALAALGLVSGIAAPRMSYAAARETVCAQCGSKAPAFLAGQKCYHCGAPLPKAETTASPAPGAPASAAPAAPAVVGSTSAPVANAGAGAAPPWFTARLPSSGFTVEPPATLERVQREVQIPPDGLAPAGTARAGAATTIPLPNGPYAAIAVTAEHRGADGSPGVLYVEAHLADGSWWGRVMKVAGPTADAKGPTLCAFWPPAAFTELRLTGLDTTGAFGQGAALIQSVQVQP